MFAILILDPKPIVCLGLSQLLLSAYPLATIHNGHPCQNGLSTPQQNYDLILLSLLSDTPPTQVLTPLMHRCKPTFIILLIEPTHQPLLLLYQQFPAIRGLIAKDASPELILASVHLVLSGGTCFPHRVAENPHLLLDDFISNPSQPLSHHLLIQQEAQMLGLTQRQYEVLVLLSQGHPLKTIAKQLNISVATTKTHTETVYQRLNVHNRNAAVYTAIAKGATLGWPDSIP